MNECMPIFTNSAGSIMENILKTKSYLQLRQACGAENYAQDDNHLVKITIDEKDKNYKIISKAYRNHRFL